ncbi:MAG: AMP-binding protein [Cyanomargarita calcarea GSE-NOS-MK-12-04C]|uniref:AMP-binding protein n=1 Tax=Cyanomargarita calcarea GSE-NOS-MK-12-04C TaxID=2839659 RepID=A0A951UTG5_9CYAN|nr:AMP-binding protein [Cyanomargarita calcarea GSE-NOS-MK-12-04C]
MKAEQQSQNASISANKPSQIAGLVDYSNLRSLPEIWQITAKLFPDTVALIDPHAKAKVSLTYAQLNQQIQQFATGIQALGVNGDATESIPPRIALIADNSPRWLIADQGIMLAGAANAVRSSVAEKGEILYIIEHSGSIGLVVENIKTLKKLTPELSNLPLQWVVLLSDEDAEENPDLKVFNFTQLMDLASKNTLEVVKQNHQTLATLIYTSGTTGKPKGVMLSHGNFVHQLTSCTALIQPNVGDKTLSILPTWHSFGRIGEYYLLSQGCTQIYTNRRYFKEDLETYTPQYVVGVPRLWESIYEGIQKSFRQKSPKMQKIINNFLSVSESYIKAARVWKRQDLKNLHPSNSEIFQARIKTILLAPLHYLGELIVYKKIQQATGGKLKQLICGGGSIAQHLEDFFEIVGIDILVGYGLTETSPVLTARRPKNNLRGSSGLPIANTQIKIVDLETHKALPQGQRGLVMAKGPQIMQGYYLNPEATQKAIDNEGWFDTGDIGWLTPDNQIVLTGRAKDTIVLTNGENIEPQPIEDACLRSAYIDQIMLVGQDQKSLGALIVPNLDALEAWLLSKNQPMEGEIDLNSKMIRDLFREELNREVRDRTGYRRDDEVIVFDLIKEPFSVENGLLTQTLKIRRNVVADNYQEVIKKMFR